MLQTIPKCIQSLQWILDETQHTCVMQQGMTDDGMESTKEIPCHLVLLIVCWHHDLQIPVHVAFERMCKEAELKAFHGCAGGRALSHGGVPRAVCRGLLLSQDFGVSG